MAQEELVEDVNLFDDGKPQEKTLEAVIEPVVNESPSFEVPDKFKGKSKEEIAESYVNLEKEAGRRANEVGELRKLTDQILQQQVAQGAAPQQNEQVNEVGFDDFIDNPAAAVDQALANNPRLKALEENLINQRGLAAKAQILERHSDVDEIMASPEFQTWITETPTRSKLLQEAHASQDVDLASDVFTMYKQTRQTATEEARVERDSIAKADLKKAAVETGTAPASTKPRYKRSDLIRLKIEQPNRYEAMSAQIRLAYAEGRVT